MREELECKVCSIKFEVIRTGKKLPNGAHERIYLENNVSMRTIKCYECYRRLRNSKWRDRKKSYYKYEKTKNGFLMRLYRNMKSRITGVQKKKFHLYKGLEILGKEDFYNWAKSSNDFHEMFQKWEESNYDRKLTPSVDRINPEIGYVITNMQWLTHSENSARIRSSKNFKVM